VKTEVLTLPATVQRVFGGLAVGWSGTTGTTVLQLHCLDEPSLWFRWVTINIGTRRDPISLERQSGGVDCWDAKQTRPAPTTFDRRRYSPHRSHRLITSRGLTRCIAPPERREHHRWTDCSGSPRRMKAEEMACSIAGISDSISRLASVATARVETGGKGGEIGVLLVAETACSRPHPLAGTRIAPP